MASMGSPLPQEAKTAGEPSLWSLRRQRRRRALLRNIRAPPGLMLEPPDAYPVDTDAAFTSRGEGEGEIKLQGVLLGSLGDLSTRLDARFDQLEEQQQKDQDAQRVFFTQKLFDFHLKVDAMRSSLSQLLRELHDGTRSAVATEVTRALEQIDVWFDEFGSQDCEGSSRRSAGSIDESEQSSGGSAPEPRPLDEQASPAAPSDERGLGQAICPPGHPLAVEDWGAGQLRRLEAALVEQRPESFGIRRMLGFLRQTGAAREEYVKRTKNDCLDCWGHECHRWGGKPAGRCGLCKAARGFLCSNGCDETLCADCADRPAPKQVRSTGGSFSSAARSHPSDAEAVQRLVDEDFEWKHMNSDVNGKLCAVVPAVLHKAARRAGDEVPRMGKGGPEKSAGGRARGRGRGRDRAGVAGPELQKGSKRGGK